MTACLNQRSFMPYPLTVFAYPAGGSVNRPNCVRGAVAAGYAFFFRSFRARAGQFDTAHLPSTRPAQRRRRTSPSAGTGPWLSAAISPARDPSPKTHGPHCPALSSAYHAMIRAVSDSPQAPSGRTITTPAPGEAPAEASPALLKARPNRAAGTQVPKKPPTRAAATRPTGPARPTMVASGVPTGTSITPGRATAPLTVTRAVPGSSGVPERRNQVAPLRAIWATWLRVSTLPTSVGRRKTPRSKGRGAVVGRAGPPLTKRTRALSSPLT